MMACPAITTGQSFLAATLAHIDCQAKTLGSFGFAALADPGSPVSVALTSLLTIFIALFGVRLLLGYPIAGRDVVGDIIKVGIVLTLATSWPAWRIVGYDLVINGPFDIARAIGIGAGLPGVSDDLASRLQQADNAIAALNTYGSGRLGVAQGDWFQLGLARIAFLVGTLGPLALIRLMAGILLAIAPLIAGLLLFGVTRSIFIGWAKGLVMTFLGSLAMTLLLSAQLAMLEPWLQDALVRRAGDQQILDAPVEVLAMTLAFAVVALGGLAIMARIAFYPSASSAPVIRSERPAIDIPRASGRSADGEGAGSADSPSRATMVALSVSDSLRREERMMEVMRSAGGTRVVSEAAAGSRGVGKTDAAETLGGSYRRNTRRVSAANRRRDQAR